MPFLRAMPISQATFDLQAALSSAEQALAAVVCHIGFQAAVHGLAFSLVLGLAGLICQHRGLRFGKPLLAVCAKLGLFCLLLMVPGALSLIVSGQLPPTGSLHISSLGFIVFWSLICLHLSAEEMNYQWF